MIRAEYKNKNMTISVSGSITDIIIELDCLLQEIMKTQPEIVNGCLSYEADNISNSLKSCDVEKVAVVESLLKSKIEKGVDN